VEVARAAQALAPRVAPSFLKWKEFLKYSIENIQPFEDREIQIGKP
jgi:hypothetical protein